ncbi:MAG: hypothetical protein RL268_1678, partial [Pseudomonadota bacterium]
GIDQPGTDDFGRRVSNGVFFYRLEAGTSEAQWGKILVLDSAPC